MNMDSLDEIVAVNDDYDEGGSLFDESEIRKELLTDKWRQIFDKFDPEGFGEIPWDDFLKVLEAPEFRVEISEQKVQIFQEKAGQRKANSITFQDFVNVMSGKRSRSFKCAVHHRDREISSEKDYHLLPKNPTLFQKMVKLVADEYLIEERDKKYYADNYQCCPPPWFIIFITIVELGFFTYYTILNGELSASGPVPIDSIFLYRPDKRSEIWRFVFYMVLHSGWLHLTFNLSVQLLVGLPLEMVHGSTRIGIVYMSGVLAGSLGTSIFDKDVYLVGASGGVYALLAAHLANVLLNYYHMEFGILRLVGILMVASADVGFAIYDRYAEQQLLGPSVSYVSHLTGALAGLTIGYIVLKNFEQKLHEQLIWWVALGVYAACTIFAILYNVFTPYPDS